MIDPSDIVVLCSLPSYCVGVKGAAIAAMSGLEISDRRDTMKDL